MRLPLLLLQLPPRPSFAAPATSQPHGHTQAAAGRPSRPRCSPLLPRLRVPMTPRRWRRCAPPTATAAAAAAPATSQSPSHAHRTARQPRRPCCSAMPLPPAPPDGATAVTALCGSRCCCCSGHCDPHPQRQLPASRAATPVRQRDGRATLAALRCRYRPRPPMTPQRWRRRATHAVSAAAAAATHSQRQLPASHAATPARQRRGKAALAALHCRPRPPRRWRQCAAFAAAAAAATATPTRGASHQPSARPHPRGSETTEPHSLLSDAAPACVFK